MYHRFDGDLNEILRRKLIIRRRRMFRGGSSASKETWPEFLPEGKHFKSSVTTLQEGV